MKNQTIRLRKNVVAKIFPEKLTKMRMEDFTNKAVDNKGMLNKRESNALVNFRINLSSRGNTETKEFYAKKNKKGIELIPF